MYLSLYCIPCMLNQVVDAIERTGADEPGSRRVLAEACRLMSEELAQPPTPIAVNRRLNDLVAELTGCDDPYREVKERHIKAALELLPELRRVVEGHPEPLAAALKAAAAGNVLDVTVNTRVEVNPDLDSWLDGEFAVLALDDFRRQVGRSQRVLVLGDNAGETVFDRLMLEQLQGEREIVYAVKERPVVNDATMQEARDSGLEEVARLVSSGCSTPGILLDHCRADFLSLFYQADLVIAKGMGNYEALSRVERPIFFLLKAKCAPVAADLGVEVGQYVFAAQEHLPANAASGSRRG